MIEDIFSNLAKDINDSVQKVLSSQEFSDLKQTVKTSFTQFEQGGPQPGLSQEEQARRREEYRRQQEERQRERARQQEEYRRQQQLRQQERARQQEEYRRQQQAAQQRAAQRRQWNYGPDQSQQPGRGPQAGQNPQAGRVQQRMQGQPVRQQPQMRQAVPRTAGPQLVPIRSGGAIFQTIIGAMGSFVGGVAVIRSLILTLMEISLGGMIRTSFLAALFTVFLVLLLTGAGKVKTLNRYRNYRLLLRGRDFCRISDLATTTGISERKVTRDLEQMIERKLLPEGYFDEKRTCIILNKATYQQYLTTQENARRQQQVTQESAADPRKAALAQAQAEGSRYIWRIREINAELTEEEISGQLDRLAEVCQKIFTYVEEHPEKLSDIRKFMSYYLPTTLKLLEAYKNLEQKGIQSADSIATRKEIKHALQNIILAFENLLGDLVKDDLMDLSADISVLESMLAQEGLMGEEEHDPEEPENPLHL